MRKIKILSFYIIISLLLIYGGTKADSSCFDLIKISADSGFYDSEFYLEISSGKNYSLHYTLDGSAPSMDSPVYREPLLITDVSSNDNVVSAHTEISPALNEEELKRYDKENQQGFAVPDFPVDKCSILRVGAFNREGTCVSTAFRVFFVGFADKTGYDQMKVVSLITSPENLFDYETGIYTMGKYYDEYDEQPEVRWLWWDANYFQEGVEWEREACINIFDEGRNEILSSLGGIRVHGGGTRGYPQKAFSLYARTDYNGSEVFMTDLFGTDKKPHKIVLSNGGNDVKLKIKDYIVQNLEREHGSNFATLDMFPCALFLNGEYWGVYYITDSYNANYIESHYNVNEDEIIMIKNYGIVEGEDADYNLYDEVIQYIRNHDMSQEECYDAICKMIDMDSFVDYYATEIYVANDDWPDNIIAAWRSKHIQESNPYFDGKWRWMLYDVNYEIVMSDAFEDSMSSTLERDWILSDLIQNEKVKEMFRERFRELEMIYAPERVEELINGWLGLMREPTEKNTQRYYGQSDSDDSCFMGIEDIQEFFENRPAYIEQCIEYYLE